MVELPAPGGPIVLGLKVALTPMGTPEAERLMELLKPPLMVVVMVTVPAPFWPTLSAEGVAEIVKFPVAASGMVNSKTLNRDRRTMVFLFGIIRPTFHLHKHLELASPCK